MRNQQTTLGDDFKNIIDEVNRNSQELLTSVQKAEYVDGKARKVITQPQLGDNPRGRKSLRLLIPDIGGDNAQLTNRSSKTVDNALNYRDDHIFFNLRETVRIGLFFFNNRMQKEDLGIYTIRLAHLIFKADFEQCFARAESWSHGQGVTLNSLLMKENKVKRFCDKFKSHSKTYFEVMEQAGNLATQIGYCENRFENLIRLMKEKNLHLAPNDGTRLNSLIEGELSELALAKEGSPEIQNKFITLKKNFLLLIEEVEARAIEELGYIRRNEFVRVKWLKKFGNAYIERKQVVLELEYLRKKLSFTLDYEFKDMVEEEIDELLRDEEKNGEKQIKRSREEIERIPFLDTPDANGHADEVQIADYESRIKQIRRRILVLCHSDKLDNHPDYQKLTLEQKKKLREIYFITNPPKQSDLCFKAGQVGYTYHSLSTFIINLSTVESILGTVGIDTSDSTEIKGDTVYEKIDWLKKEVVFYEMLLSDIDSSIQGLLNNPSIRQVRNEIASPESSNDVEARLKSETQKFQQQIEEIKDVLRGHFSGRAE